MVLFLNDYEALVEWKLLEENLSLRKNPVPKLLPPPQIPHTLQWVLYH